MLERVSCWISRRDTGRHEPTSEHFLNRFFKMLGTQETRAWYGPNHVCLAAERGAVGTLLISDELFR